MEKAKGVVKVLENAAIAADITMETLLCTAWDTGYEIVRAQSERGGV